MMCLLRARVCVWRGGGGNGVNVEGPCSRTALQLCSATLPQNALNLQISAKEKILGFYSTGPRIRVADTKIDALFRSSRYCTRPLLLIVEVQPTVEGLPVQAYVTREEVAGGGRDLVRTFVHVPTEVGAYDAEAVGVEHLLRDINNPSTSTLAGDIQGKVVGLKGLAARLGEVAAYLEKVLDGRLPQNNELLNQLQVRALCVCARARVPCGGWGIKEGGAACRRRG